MSKEWEKTFRFLKRFSEEDPFDKIYEEAGRQGVEALKNSTPKETGQTASSWFYEIKKENSKVTIEWHNSHIHNGCNIAILLQYGHGTGTGGYVQGTDYINPAMIPVFQNLADSIWKEVTKR